jgi:hypothetical protein
MTEPKTEEVRTSDKTVYLTRDMLAFMIKECFLFYKETGIIPGIGKNRGKMHLRVLQIITDEYNEFKNLKELFDQLISDNKQLQL